MPSDASGSFRAAGLGPVAGRQVSAQVFGTPPFKADILTINSEDHLRKPYVE